MSYDSKITGRIIRELRIKKHLSQEVFSGFAGIARSHLTAIEKGEKNPNVNTLWKIADALDMPLSDLILIVEKTIENQEEEKPSVKRIML